MERKNIFFTRTKARLDYYWTDQCLFFTHLIISIGEKPKRDTIFISDIFKVYEKDIRLLIDANRLARQASESEHHASISRL